MLNVGQSRIIRLFWQPLRNPYGNFTLARLDSLEKANEKQKKQVGLDTKQDNLVGLVEGKKIGQNINRLTWKR